MLISKRNLWVVALIMEFSFFFASGCSGQSIVRDPLRMMQRFDANRDGGLDYPEFKEIGQIVERLKSENVSGFIFSSLDLDNDGVLSTDEFAKIRGGERSLMPAGPFDPVAVPVGANPLRSLLPEDDASSAPPPSIDRSGDQDHWAFQPMRSVSNPSVLVMDKELRQWPLSQIDQYLAAAMQSTGVRPVGDTDRATFLRRLSFDLIGLPPTAAEVLAFMADPRDDTNAIADVVDRLLQSKHFGEHWGRHWLDVARFGESSGRDTNIFYPYAWRYRDYVIEAFNADKPYDDFIREQIAGDLLPATNDRQRAQQIIATGYLAIGPKTHTEIDQRQFSLDVVDEQIDAVSRGILGISIACARCHDHKFDPVSQQQYYQLAGIFASTETLYGGARTIQTNRTTGLVELPESSGVSAGRTMSRGQRESLTRRLKFVSAMPGFNPIKAIITATAGSTLAMYDSDGVSRRLAMAVREAQPLDLPILLRGEMNQPSDRTPRGIPSLVSTLHSDRVTLGSGRLELSDWMTSPENPLTARVMANRVWMHLMGKGLVGTIDDFGLMGQSPTHPDLLDHLALTLIDDGWSIKSLVRRICNSHVYRLDTTTTPVNLRLDPENKLIWRHTKRRLPAESIRDAILMASGTLDPTPASGSAVMLMGNGQARVLDRDATAMQGLAISNNPTGESGPVRRNPYLRRDAPPGNAGDPQSALDRGELARSMDITSRRDRMRNRFGRFRGRGRAGNDRSPPIRNGRPDRGSIRRGDAGGMTAFRQSIELDIEPNKRSVYLPVIRDRPDPMLDAFDFPNASLVTGRREVTTIASQSLFLLNSEFVIERSAAMATALQQNHQTTAAAIQTAFLRTLSRQPRPEEIAAAKHYMGGFDSSNRSLALQTFCQSLMATAEFQLH